jgi:hypothetical protein
MALSDKNIVITPATSTGGQPTIRFTAGTVSTVNTITFKVLDTGPISIEGNAGQLMSIVDSNTGTLFSVNDISGIPSIEVLDTGVVRLAGYGGQVAQGVSSSVPAGTTQADATPITTPIVYVTTSTGTLPGFVLPSATPGVRITVIHRADNPTRYWPNVGNNFEGFVANSPTTASSITSNLVFLAVTTATWIVSNSGNNVL